MKAVTLSYDMGGFDTADPASNASVLVDDTGDVMNSLLGDQTQIAEPNAETAGIGESLGMLAGAGLGSFIGPAGTALGSGLGKIAGGAVERLVDTSTRKSPPSRPAQKRLSKNEMKILAEGEKMTQRTGNKAYAEDARLRVYRPAEYQRRRAAGWIHNHVSRSPDQDCFPMPPSASRGGRQGSRHPW